MAYTSVTLETFRGSLRSRLGNTSFWSDTELENAIREAMRTWNVMTGTWAKKVVLPTSAAQAWVTLPTSLVASTRLERQGTPLKQTAIRDLDNAKPGWETTSGTPSWWAPVASNMIALYPVPTSGDHSIVIDGVVQTPTMSSSTDTVDLDQGLFDALLNYARHLLLFKLGGREFEESKSARKRLFEMAGRDNQRLQASAPFRTVMGQVSDVDRQALHSGEKKVGVR